MENIKVYLVSFSDSRQYIMRDSAESEKAGLVEIENSLNAFLSDEFPDDTFAYYTTPKVVEITEELAASEYADYPELDEKAVEEIKKELEREVKNMRANKELNEDAPFSDVDPEAADLPPGMNRL